MQVRVLLLEPYALVAQWIRAAGFYPDGWGFESLRAYCPRRLMDRAPGSDPGIMLVRIRPRTQLVPSSNGRTLLSHGRNVEFKSPWDHHGSVV